jgi:cell division protein FtsW
MTMVAHTDTGSRNSRSRWPAALLLCLAVGLAAFGLVVLTSAGKSAKPSDPNFIFRRQSLWLPVALLSGVFATYVNLDLVRRHVWKIYAATCVLLLAVRIPHIGRPVKGSWRWIQMGPVNLQVSDLGKIALILALSHYLANHRRWFSPPRPALLKWRWPFIDFLSFRQIQKFPYIAPLNEPSGDFLYGFVGPVSIFGGICALVLIEPDLGTTILCASVGGILLFVAGVRHLFVWPAVCAGLAGAAAMVVLLPTRMRRVLAFLDPEGRKMDEAYQLWQGMLGFAVGGRDGAGLGQGMQQESFLPEAHTDFVFAIVGEEMGLWFTLGVSAAFLGMFWVVAANLRRQQDVFRFNVCLGAMLFIVLQALINMGVVTGLLPTKGMSLPFISYGGTNLVMMFVLVGLILNCMRTASRIPLAGGRELP